jgi:hypothetical protein
MGMVGLPGAGPQLERGGQGHVDARPEVLVGAVPGQRYGVAFGQHHLVTGVVEDELPLGEDVVQLRPVGVERLAVQVVLGPDLIAEVPDAVPEFGPFAVAHYLRVHPPSIAL